MRQHGRAEVDSNRPRAWGVCQRCGFLYNHDRLSWQYEYGGLRLINLRILVCPTCKDEPQIQLRTLILPPDPVPIEYAVPEDYVDADNPLSADGAAPEGSPQTLSAQIGTMYNTGAAFDGNANKPLLLSAHTTVLDSSLGNYIGINWTGYPSGTFPSSLDYPITTHTLGSFSITAPLDSAINSSTYYIQGSSLGSSIASQWTTLASGNPANTNGEVISGTISGGARYQFHRVAFSGGIILTSSLGVPITTSSGAQIIVTPTGGDAISLAQVQFFVTDGSST